MDKFARKPSSDPKQEALRQSKSVWNTEVSKFISNLINFKKMMNGAPSNFFPQKSKIQEPIPANPETIIGVLASDFTDIATKANNIAEQQIEYSRTRRKKQEQQASDGKFASNPVTRFISKFKGLPSLTPFLGNKDKARLRSYRVSLLNLGARIWRDLRDLEGVVLNSSADALETAKLSKKIVSDFTAFSKSYELYKKEQLKDLSIEEKAITEPEQNLIDQTILDKLEDFANVFIITSFNNDYNVLPANQVTDIISLINKIKKGKLELIPQFNLLYGKALDTVKEELIKKLIDEPQLQPEINSATTFATLKSIVLPLKKEARQNELGILLKRLKHQLVPGKMSAVALEASKKIEKFKNDVEDILDSLESTIDTGVLDEFVVSAQKQLVDIDSTINILTNKSLGDDFFYKDLKFDADEQNLLKRRMRMSEISKLLGDMGLRRSY